MPLAACGVLFSLLQAVFENVFYMQTGYATLLSALFVAPISLFAYKYAVVHRAENRKGHPSELKFEPRLFISGVVLAGVVISSQLLAISFWGDVHIIPSQHVLEGIANALGIAIFAGILEELFCRGVVFRISERYIGSILAIMFSAIVFGLPHMFNPGATLWTGIAITIQAGITLALIFIVTRNLWATIGVHMGWNFLVTTLGLGDVGAFQTILTGHTWLVGGKYGIEDSVFVCTVWLIVALVFYILAKKHKSFVSYKTARKQKHPI